MQRSHTSTALSQPATTGATAPMIEGGLGSWAAMARRLAPSFARSECRQRVLAYLRGLLSEAERKNRWQVAEGCGEPTPDGVPYGLRRADWDADAVRDELRIEVMQPLGDPNGVLVVDETGFLKKGAHSAGGARQSRGTAGNVEHGQIGVLLGQASPLGHALLERARPLPKAWPVAGERGRPAGIPTDRPFAPTPPLARQMLARAGGHRRLRRWLEGRPQPYGLAVSGTAQGWLGSQQRHVKTLLASLPPEGWTRLRAGDGTQGPRWDDWRWLPLAAPLEPGWRRWRRVRRRLSAPTELTAQSGFHSDVWRL